ncbi:hypothetical protein Ahy_A07g036638 [Arachis hypogaea]|uniref:Uncharacterized protein n=1 Tax=Arachis hypogaea TaxID=3818 RepID=A0A445CGN2_ARAHY|nr:hypothetical protein Ahy_A07g036638 [Arachis hypogaea]
MDVFFIRNYYKELGYDNILQCWWLPLGRSLDGGLMALTCDGELREMCFAAQKNDGVVDVYFEHGVSTLEVIAEKEVVVWLDDTCEGDLVSKKNTSEGPKTDGNTSNPTTEPNHIPNANPSPIDNPIPTLLKPTLFVNKGKEALHVDLIVNDDSSDDDSSEDSSFKPIQEDSSSSEDNANDALVDDVSNGEVDLGFVETPGIIDVYEALEPCAESDGANSWHSEEMKTPPNFEDKLQSDEDSDEFPIFRNGTRFGELQLQVGMKFNTKYEFREDVREYTIQEGRRIKFKKNKNIRCRVMCKVKECACVVYASRDCDDSCWQIKTFNDDHTCARENTNMAANRAWVASIPCVHACAALARVNKRPKDFCHQLYTMEAYNKIYVHHINPLPDQSLWEKFMYTQPQAPNIRRRPGALTKKRRKDADEGNNGNKKAKSSGSLKRHLKPFTCRYCGVKGHTKRGCSKKRLDEVAATDKAKSNATASASKVGPQPHTDAVPVDKPPAVEIEISQPNYERSQDIAGSATPTPSRPEKLPTKRRSPPPPQSIGVDPMQGAIVATSFRLANL